LPIDPTGWVEAIRPSLMKREILTSSELRICWYPREHGRMDCKLDHVEWPDGVPEKFDTANGRRVEPMYDGARARPSPRHMKAAPVFAEFEMATD
jgi:hypothetical protein